jgi:hypothetical protein
VSRGSVLPASAASWARMPLQFALALVELPALVERPERRPLLRETPPLPAATSAGSWARLLSLALQEPVAPH